MTSDNKALRQQMLSMLFCMCLVVPIMSRALAAEDCNTIASRLISRPPFTPDPPIGVIKSMLLGYCVKDGKFHVGPDNIAISYISVSNSFIYRSASSKDSYTKTQATASCETENIRELRGVFLILPGYGLAKTTMLSYAQYFADKGFLGIMIDLPGQGQSGGNHIGFGPYESNYITKLVDDLSKKYRYNLFGVAGYSYGATVALDAASSQPKIRLIVGVAPFVRTVPTIKRFLGEDALLGKGKLVDSCVVDAANEKLGYKLQRSGPIVNFRKVKGRALIINGGRDSIATPKDIANLEATAPSQMYVTIQSADHAQLLTDFKGIIWRAMDNLVNSSLAENSN